MKKRITAIISVILIFAMSFMCCATVLPQSYMEISVTEPFGIFTKNMQDEKMLASVGKSAEEINEILESTGSESLIINKETGAQIYVKVVKNDLSYELWNISKVQNEYINENLKNILYDGFLMEGFNYQDENVIINDYAYMKFITVSGSTYSDNGARGVVCGGTFVNGNAIVFTMLTDSVVPTEEEIKAVNDIASGVSFTVIKEKTDEKIKENKKEEQDIFNYILGGFGALVIIIFCACMIVKMRTKDEDEEKPENSEEIRAKSE